MKPPLAVTFNGRTMPLGGWSRETGLGEATIRHRIKRGWPVDRLFIPVRVPDIRYKKYLAQKKAAAERGIPWEFTLETWWAVWDVSGHWHERGRGKDK